MKTRMGMILLAGLGLSALITSPAFADHYVRTIRYEVVSSEPVVLVSSHNSVKEVVCTVSKAPRYEHRAVWVKPHYVWENHGCGRTVKVYKPGRYEWEWVRVNK